MAEREREREARGNSESHEKWLGGLIRTGEEIRTLPMMRGKLGLRWSRDATRRENGTS